MAHATPTTTDDPLTVYLDPKVWGPPYWFFLHTVAMTYPQYPNAVTKKTYYEFYEHLPLFIPVDHVSQNVARWLKEQPVSPCLDTRASLVQWTHDFHNRVNRELGKPERSFGAFLEEHHEACLPPQDRFWARHRLRQKLLVAAAFAACAGIAWYTLRERDP